MIVLNGRYAGKKAVIVENRDEGTKTRPYGHAVVAGVAKYPKKVTKTMGKKKIAKKTRITPFVKAINYNHLMPTRYEHTLSAPIRKTLTMRSTGMVLMLSSRASSRGPTPLRRVRTSTRPRRLSRRSSRPGIFHLFHYRLLAS